MDRDTAQWYAARLTKSGVVTTPKTVRETGPLAAVWGVQQHGHAAAKVYSHPDAFPPHWRTVLATACINCGTMFGTSPMYNQMTGTNDMWCVPCFYGEPVAA